MSVDPTPTNALRSQGRWRAPAASLRRSSAPSRLVIGLVLLGIALVGAALVAAALLAPFFRWQTAAVALVIEQYPAGVVESVPFATEDREGFGQALTGLLDTRIGKDVVDLTGLESAGGLRELLLPRMRRLKLRTKDVMIAYVRGQAIIGPAAGSTGLDRDDPLSGHGCFLASDITMSGQRPRELVPVREIVEAIGAAAPFVTLHAIDLGDIKWDPRLGVLAGFVPLALDADFAAPQKDARYHNWIIGSHDVFQHSGVSLTGGRSYFSRALELALAGAADAAPAGDGDGIVELHEVIDFVKSWTSEWVRRASGGRVAQTPVVWKLGVGRVAAADVPRDVALIRLANRKTAAPKAADDDAKPTATSPDAAAQKPAATGSGAPAKGSQSPLPTATPSSAPAASPQAPAAQPTPPPPGPSPAPEQPTAGDSPVAAAQAGQGAGGAGQANAPASQTPAAAGQAASGAAAATTGAANAPNPSPGKGTQAPGEPAAPSAAGPSAAQPPGPGRRSGNQASPTSPQPTPDTVAPVRPENAWQALALFGDRRRTMQGLPSPGFDQPPAVVPVDYVPHLWNRAFALVASAEVRRHSSGPLRERNEVAFTEFGKELGALWIANGSSRTELDTTAPRTIGSLLQSTATITASREFRDRWMTAPTSFTRAIAARDDAIITVASVIDVTSRLAGGAATPPIDPARIRSLINKVTLLTAAIRRYRTAADTAVPNPQEVNLLETATRTTVAETAMLMELLQSLTGTSVPTTTMTTALHRSAFQSIVAVLRSPVISPQLREEIRQAILPPAPDAAQPPVADGSLPPVVEMAVLIDPQSLDNIASRTLDVVSLVEASVVGGAAEEALRTDFGDLASDIAAVRLAAAALTESSKTHRESLERIATLGGLVAQVFTRVAKLVRKIEENEQVARVSVDDAASGLLRVMDPRDVATLDRTIYASMPLFQQRSRVQIAFTADTDALAVETPLEGRLAVQGGKGLPPDGRVRFSFDPADVEIILPAGREVDADVPIPVASLPIVDGTLSLKIRARRERSGAGDLSHAVVRVECDSSSMSAAAELRFVLPARRGLVVTGRRTPSELGMADDAWRFSRPLERSSLPVAAGRPQPATRSLLELVAIPGMTSFWQFGLENPAEIPRTFSARLYELPALTPLNSQSGRTRTDVWTEFCDLLDSGGSLPTPLLVVDKVTVAPRSSPVPIALAPPATPAAAPPAAPPAPAAAGAAADKPAEKPLADLALVITEATPGEPARTFAVRLILSVEHPRNRLQATAVWTPDDRLISVQVGPTAEAGVAALPPEGLWVEMEPLPPGLGAATQPLVLRRASTALTPRRATDTLTAVWQGSDLAARADVAVSVNGYPRAFVFSVDCTPASAGVPQGPQEDFRGIAFAGPRPVVPPLVKAPAASIPLSLLVDAPPDLAAARAAGAAGPSATVGPAVTLAFRGLRGNAVADAAQQVWSASSDRQVFFTLDKPKPPATLAIATKVADWSIAPTGEGYVDLDLEAEATLAVPGTRSLLKATRLFVMDARPPAVEVPPLVNATIGRPLTVPVMAVDDPRESSAGQPGRHIPGVSGIAKVEWALDAKGDGKPEAWTPAVGLGGGRYEVQVDTAKLPPGARTPLLVRAVDRVGLSNPPSRTWIDTAVKPAKGSIQGRVTLKGIGEANVTVRIDGPNAPPPVRSGRDGAFSFTDLDPGSYTLKATGPVRNRTCASEATPAVVAPPPAPTAKVTLELK